MKTIASILTLASMLALGLATGCGDNLAVDEDGEIGEQPSREGDVLIIPQSGMMLDALAAAEEFGYTDTVILEDQGAILGWGDLTWADDVKALPGIYDVIPAPDARPYEPDTDLGAEPSAPEAGPGPESDRIRSLGIMDNGLDSVEDADEPIYSPDEVIGGRR